MNNEALKLLFVNDKLPSGFIDEVYTKVFSGGSIYTPGNYLHEDKREKLIDIAKKYGIKIMDDGKLDYFRRYFFKTLYFDYIFRHHLEYLFFEATGSIGVTLSFFEFNKNRLDIYPLTMLCLDLVECIYEPPTNIIWVNENSAKAYNRYKSLNPEINYLIEHADEWFSGKKIKIAKSKDNKHLIRKDASANDQIIGGNKSKISISELKKIHVRKNYKLFAD